MPTSILRDSSPNSVDHCRSHGLGYLIPVLGYL